MNKQDFIALLKQQDIVINEKQYDDLVDFMHYTLTENEKFNLTAIKDEETFFEKMIFDSLLAIKDLDLKDKKAIDVGTGAGYPGMALALTTPLDLTLLDSTNKKINYLNAYIENNHLKNVIGVNARIEDFAHQNIEKYDYVFARAVAPLNILLEMVMPLLKVGGVFIALKGPSGHEEISLCQKAMKKLTCHVDKIIETELYLSKEKRLLIHIKKDQSTPIKYPRSYLLIKKQPL